MNRVTATNYTAERGTTMNTITINCAYNTETLEIIETVNSRNWIRRKIFAGWNTLPRYWKFYSKKVPADYFRR